MLDELELELELELVIVELELELELVIDEACEVTVCSSDKWRVCLAPAAIDDFM
jgi:hypothetical protein